MGGGRSGGHGSAAGLPSAWKARLEAAPARPDAVAAAAVAGAGGEVIPLGRAVGIKLFSDGVLVVGLSSIDTAEGPAAPGRTSGLKAGDVITHIDQTEGEHD